MANLMKSLGKYIGKYLNTRVVFALDMFMSLASSLITLVLATFFSSADLFAVKPAVVWMGTSFLSSFFLIWGLHTYRIIIRHMTVREFGRFVMVAFCKSLASGFVFSIAVSKGLLLFMLMLADFFITFGAFLFLRMAMLVSNDSFGCNPSSCASTEGGLRGRSRGSWGNMGLGPLQLPMQERRQFKTLL